METNDQERKAPRSRSQGPTASNEQQQGETYQVAAVADDDLKRFADWLFRYSAGVHEIRVLNSHGGWYGTRAGWFDNPEDFVSEARRVDEDLAEGVYFTLNPCDPVLLARANNRIKDRTKRGEATQDPHILRRRLALFDFDASRVVGISSTDEEHEAALEAARRFYDRLTIPRLLGSSGNGGHVLVPVDLPVDDDGLIAATLHALAEEFDSGLVELDLKVFNPARISKVFGTTARKGEDIPDRPWRPARILDITEGELDGHGWLEALAGPKRAAVSDPASRKESSWGDGPNESEPAPLANLRAFLKRHAEALTMKGREAPELEDWEPDRDGRKGKKAEIVCITPELHTDKGDPRGEAWVGWREGEADWYAGCHHLHCTWTKTDLRARFGETEPNPVSPPSTEEPSFHMELLSETHPTAYHLAWDGRLVRGGLNILRGDEKIGKGVMACHLVAQATRGEIERLPEPVFVFVFTKEDKAVINGRLVAAGAAPNQVSILKMGSLTLPRDIRHLEQMALGAHDQGHVNVWFYFDGLQSYFELHYDTNNAQRVGYVLDELTLMAERSKSYLLTNMHTNRMTTGTAARQRDAHSVEFRRVARSNLYLVKPEDEEGDIRYLGQQGNNYGEDAPTLRYRIKSVMVEVVDDDESTIHQRFPVMELLGTTELSMDEHYVREADTERRIKESRTEPSRVEQCKAAILEFWKAQGRPDRLPSNLVLGHLKLRGFRRGKTSQAAMTELGIVTEAPAEVGGHGYWNFEVLLAGPTPSVTAPACLAPSVTPSFTPGSKAGSPHAVHRQDIEKVNNGVSRENSNPRRSLFTSPEDRGGEKVNSGVTRENSFPVDGEPRNGERRVACPSCGHNNGIPGARSECWKCGVVLA